jgi:hypothetical protein
MSNVVADEYQGDGENVWKFYRIHITNLTSMA